VPAGLPASRVLLKLRSCSVSRAALQWTAAQRELQAVVSAPLLFVCFLGMQAGALDTPHIRAWLYVLTGAAACLHSLPAFASIGWLGQHVARRVGDNVVGRRPYNVCTASVPKLEGVLCTCVGAKRGEGEDRRSSITPACEPLC